MVLDPLKVVVLAPAVAVLGKPTARGRTAR